MVAIRQKGAGDPVLLIGGVGADMFLWFRQIPELSKHFQVIAFDSRGAGESGKPDEPYTIEIFAADTAGLLQELDNDLDAGSKPRLDGDFGRASLISRRYAHWMEPAPEANPIAVAAYRDQIRFW